MKEMNAGAGETVLRILEQGDPGAILHFGIEDDLVKILQDPITSMACDCGASTATRVHPRFYGSYPRVLGRYVREQKIMTLGAGDPEIELAAGRDDRDDRSRPARGRHGRRHHRVRSGNGDRSRHV